MAVTSQVYLGFVASGGVVVNEQVATTSNTNGAGKMDLLTLALGDNVITVPSSGTVPKGVVIVPPAANNTTLVLKGVGGDTGVKIHVTEPTYLSLDPTQASFIINTAGTVTGIRLFWN